MSISYHVSFQKTVNNIPAILVLWLDMDFLEPLNAFTVCVYFNGRVKYLTKISHIQLGGTHKTTSSEDFCMPNGFGEFCSENWLIMSL